MDKTQTSEVLNYLRTHKEGISSMVAFDLFGATRLSAIIFALRKKGYVIECTDKKTTNRYGGTCNYGVYTLISEPEVK